MVERTVHIDVLSVILHISVVGNKSTEKSVLGNKSHYGLERSIWITSKLSDMFKTCPFFGRSFISLEFQVS